MAVIVVASQKGGAGKTTVATNLAVFASEDGAGPVALGDMDPQGTTSSWWNRREANMPALLTLSKATLRERIQEAIASGHHVVLDTPPALTDDIRTVVRLADYVLIPVRPTFFDLEAAAKAFELVSGEKKAFAFVVTQAAPTARLTQKTIALLSQYGPVAPAIIHARQDYPNATTAALGVTEYAPKSKAADEIRELWGYVKERAHLAPLKKGKRYGKA